MSRPDSSKRGILRLPLELLQDILACLADPRSLVCAIKASRTLYYSFKGNEQHILTVIMANCIGAGVLREAQLTRDCTPPILSTRVTVDPDETPWDETPEEKLQDELWTYLADFDLRGFQEAGNSAPKSWAISDALALGNYHTEVVLPLKDRFIKAASDPASCTMAAKLRGGLEVRPVTRLEEERICRALYRFELFRRFYGCSSRLRWVAEQEGIAVEFFLKFAPWEIAQLGCIHDFLCRQIIPVFNEVARHDVVWGNYRVGFDAKIEHGTIQHLLSLGLEEILAIARLQDSPYEERRQALGPDEERPYGNFLFLWLSLIDINIDARPGNDPGLYTTLYSAPPFHPDPDPGPELIWRLSCPQDGSSLGLYEQHDWISRRWGYVFWDYARLQGLILTGDALTSETWEPRVNPVQIPEPPPSAEEREASYQVRSSIYRRGGRGYWAEGDESRVQWPENTISS
ncbi:hypothetical protein VPNG_09275 [Cytospora leucostoma]|uniref:F-box domain-containing protein n=1 Tax=Cytospora leucostoma TaxID=1230097 RepID=A0A423W0G2_9PEZI|nr:hypothetical protein VPNG_09275 [Cytospora leucostoma]